MPEAGPGGCTIAAFDKARHDRAGFCCGFAPIDRFLQKSVSEAVRAGYSRVYVATRGDEVQVLGFYALNAHAVACRDLPDLPGRGRIETIPAVYLHVVAVDRGVQGAGLGSALMLDAIRRAVRVHREIGAAVLVLDLLDAAGPEATARRRAFYERLGFAPFPGNPARMFLRLKDAAATLGG